MVLVDRLDERDRLSFIAEAGIRKATLVAMDYSQKPFHALKDEWSNNVYAFKDVRTGAGKFNVSYTLGEVEGEPQLGWGLIDEERKININKAGLGELERLFQILLNQDEVLAGELAAAIIDWRDKDSAAVHPSVNAEDSYYRALTYPYEAKDSDFEVLDEVLLIRGMTDEIFMKIKDYITIYGDGKININTAPKPVLMAIGLNEELVDKILSFRRGEDKLEATEDDNVFDSVSNIVGSLSSLIQLTEPEKNQLKAVTESYSVINSRYFMVKGAAQLNNKKNEAIIQGVIDLDGNVLYWQESL